MKKLMSLVEARSMYGPEVYEVESGYLVKKYGSYDPGLTFLIPKEFDIGKKNGYLETEAIDPLGYISDSEITDSMNLRFDGEADFIFGDFWVTEKETKCFRLQDPMKAKHILVRIEWGGRDSSLRGLSERELASTGALHYRKAKPNIGGGGYGYLVLPVGYKKPIYDPEFDGPEPSVVEEDFETRALPLRQKHSELLDKRITEGELLLKEKAEAASEKERLKDRISELEERGDCRLKFYNDGFVFDLEPFFYSERNIQMLEEALMTDDYSDCEDGEGDERGENNSEEW